jgi:hypothetical protein
MEKGRPPMAAQTGRSMSPPPCVTAEGRVLVRIDLDFTGGGFDKTSKIGVESLGCLRLAKPR